MTTILVIDDQAEMRQLFKFLLRRMDCQFLEASNGIEGQSLALKHLPEAILLDIMMPSQDGHETCLNLRHAGYDGIIFLMSAYSPSKEAERALQLGANAYLQKPITGVILQEQFEKFGLPTPAQFHSSR